MKIADILKVSLPEGATYFGMPIHAMDREDLLAVIAHMQRDVQAGMTARRALDMGQIQEMAQLWRSTSSTTEQLANTSVQMGPIPSSPPKPDSSCQDAATLGMVASVAAAIVSNG